MSFITKRIRLIVPANKAKPSPAIGQALGSVGINMMKFCKEFNVKSAAFADDLPMRVQLTVLNDGSYDFNVAIPQSSWFIKKMAQLEVFAHKPGHEIVGSIHAKQLYELALLKSQDSNDELKQTPLKSIYKSLVASCKSYGIEVNYESEEQRKIRIDNILDQRAKAAALERPSKGKGAKASASATKKKK